jgi:hypothetical protein
MEMENSNYCLAQLTRAIEHAAKHEFSNGCIFSVFVLNSLSILQCVGAQSWLAENGKPQETSTTRYYGHHPYMSSTLALNIRHNSTSLVRFSSSSTAEIYSWKLFPFCGLLLLLSVAALCCLLKLKKKNR